jgi:hypothetical protein
MSKDVPLFLFWDNLSHRTLSMAFPAIQHPLVRNGMILNPKSAT